MVSRSLGISVEYCILTEWVQVRSGCAANRAGVWYAGGVCVVSGLGGSGGHPNSACRVVDRGMASKGERGDRGRDSRVNLPLTCLVRLSIPRSWHLGKPKIEPIERVLRVTCSHLRGMWGPLPMRFAGEPGCERWQNPPYLWGLDCDQASGAVPHRVTK